MGAFNHKELKKNSKSNSSVLNKPLDNKKSQIALLPPSEWDYLIELKPEVNLPIVNDYIKPSEILLKEKKDEEFIPGYDIDTLDNPYIKKRSNSFAVKLLKAPRPRLKEPKEIISPLRLSVKTFGLAPNFDKMPNKILNDFQKNLIDSKSCNDDISEDDIFITDEDTERTTPNVEDLQNLANCRKKMTIFRNSINSRTSNEYENILSSDYLFCEGGNHHHKKNSYWKKYVKQQQLKLNQSILSSKNLRLSGTNALKRSETTIDNNNDLFILGVIENAANDRKGRKTGII